MKKILFLLCSLLATRTYAEVVTYEINFKEADFDICQYTVSSPLPNNAALLYIYPNSELRSKNNFTDICNFQEPCPETATTPDGEIIVMPCAEPWELNIVLSYYKDKTSNYFTFSYLYLAPFGKKVQNVSVEVAQSDKIRENVYIPQCASEIYNALKPDCNELNKWKVYTDKSSQMLNFVNGYKMTAHPEDPILSIAEHKEYPNLAEFSISPTYTIGTDLYLIEKFSVRIELSDDSSPSTTEEMLQYIQKSKNYLINPEAFDTYKGQNALEEVPAEELLNISGNVLTLKGTDANAVSAIFSADGRPVMSFTGGTADISTLPQGLYVLRTTAANGKNLTAKFVK